MAAMNTHVGTSTCNLVRYGGGLDLYDTIIDNDMSRLKKLVVKQRDFVDLNGRFVEARKEIHLQVCPVHLATYMGHVDIVRYLLDDIGCDVTVRTAKGRTVFHIAVTCYKLNCFNLLLSKGVDPDPRDIFQNSPLHYAAEGGICDIMEALLAKKVELDARDILAKTPLMKATRRGKVEAAKILLAAGCQVNIADQNEDIALHFAARNGNMELVELLLCAGSDVNKQNSTGRTPLLEAIFYNDREAAHRLVRAGCDVNLGEYASGNTALHVVVRKRDLRLANLLLGSCRASTVYNSQGEHAVYSAILNNNREIIDVFLQNNYDLEVAVKMEGDAKKTAVHLAAERGHLELLRLFEQLGFVMNGLSYILGCTTAHVVAMRQYLQSVDTVPSLKRSCRKMLRKKMAEELHRNVPLLPLPPYLKNYLLLKDLNLSLGNPS